VQETYARLFHHFRRRAPLQILRWAPLFVRHPRLLKLVWEALHRKVDIRAAPPTPAGRAA